MNILVIGGSQGTGALAVEAALAGGHRVSVMSRNPDRLDVQSAALRRIAGSFHDAAAIDAAIPGHDAVIVTASPTSFKALRESRDFFSSGTRLVVDAMKRAGVRRLVVLSALGVGPSRPLLPWIFRTIGADWLLKSVFADHDVQERLTQESGLGWVIVRPGRLLDAPAKGTFRKTAALEAVPAMITRADVAAFLVEAAESDAWVGKAVQIGG